MVDERNDDQYDEESEYHFSDDQSYDMEEDGQPTETLPPVKQSLLSKIAPYRRMMIGVLVFFILIFVVYVVLAPKTNEVGDEITQAAPSALSSATPAPPATHSKVPPIAATSSPPSSTSPIAAAPPPSASVPTAPAPPLPSVQTVSPAPAPSALLPVATSPAPPASVPQDVPIASSTTNNAQNQNIIDRLAVLEEQNAKLMNLLQTQVAQKMADYDAENNVAQDKVRALSKRMANIETTLNKMAQLLKEERSAQASSLMGGGAEPSLPPSRAASPKTVYSVQAIIPGRAWLKNEGGETVTVAEGDILKDFGRVVKIDPYDGIVEIDTGSKIIALSYGAGAS